MLRAFMRRTLVTTAEDTPGGKQLQERSSMSSRVNWGGRGGGMRETEGNYCSGGTQPGTGTADDRAGAHFQAHGACDVVRGRGMVRQDAAVEYVRASK